MRMALTVLRSGVVAVTVLLATAASAVAADIQTGTTELSDGVYLFRYGDQQSLFVIGSEGVIVTDPLSATAAKAYLKAVRRLTDQPVRYVAYTSSFFDRVPGAGVFLADGAEVVAQENCVTNLEATPHPEAVLPTQTYTDSAVLSVGDATLALHYFGQSYGTCLSVMIAKPGNIMMVHNLVQPPAARLPEDPTLANYYLHNLLPFFVSVESLAASEGVTQVTGSEVAADGSVLAPVKLVTRQRVFWDSLLRIVQEEYDKGTPAQVIPRKADMSDLEEFAGYDPAQVGIMMRRVYSLYRIGR